VPRILRNYLISFAIIGLIVLAVQLVNRWAARQTPHPAGSAAQDAAPAGPAPVAAPPQAR